MSAARAEQLAIEAPDPPAVQVDEDHKFLRMSEALVPTGREIQIVDLFSGCGGLTLGVMEGARRSGVSASIALAVDKESAALDVLRRTVGEPHERFRQADLKLLRSVGDALTPAERTLFGSARPALLTAGPPCQGHSALNNHTRHDDPRNDLYVSVARAAQLLEPEVVVIENVRGVGSDRRGNVDRCAELLEGLGYSVSGRRLNLVELGAPQRRVRHVLVAAAKDAFKWVLPVHEARTLRWAIGDLLDVEGTTPFDTASRVHPDNAKRIDWLFESDEDDLPNHLRPKCHHGDHTYRSMYGRLSWDAPAQTVTSGFGSMGQGRYVHPERRRTLTPHEAARLQFLPDFARLDGVTKRGALATLIGNAAPPVLTIALTRALIDQKLI